MSEPTVPVTSKDLKTINLNSRPNVIIFGLVGICLDWHSSILPTLKEAMDQASPNSENRTLSTKREAPEFALEWRQGFFDDSSRLRSCLRISMLRMIESSRGCSAIEGGVMLRLCPSKQKIVVSWHGTSN